MSSDKVKVAVRVRPFNRREKDLDTKCIVLMEKNQVILQHAGGIGEKLDGHKRSKVFAFDNCFDSIDDASLDYASQENVYQSLGEDILDNAFQGYNACIFAYGQTGSGKSYTMMGSQDNKGIIPRLCDSMFERVLKSQGENLVCKVEVSYMEIYNEKVHDLLDPGGSRQSLKVREHIVLGPYVDGLSQLAVSSYEDIDNLMTEGNKSRTVAATNMNSESSRSHAVFNVILTQTLIDSCSGVSGEKVSKLSLVDLAGSERAVKTGAVGERLKEGSNINKSLTTLGLVISKLADQSSSKSKDKFVPYRDSVLTWLLKDNLGGNSKTVMVATISPASDNYEETLSTLRYADRAKRIVNHAVVNEDPNARIIRELRAEVEALKEQLKLATVPSPSLSNSKQREDLHEKLSESEKLMKAMSQTWEEKLQNTERVQHVRQAVLEKMGISVQASGIKVEHGKYYLVNLNEDPSLNELLVYYLKDKTLVGSPCAPVEQDIQLSGLGIQPEHCVITIEKSQLFIEPKPNAKTCVNGATIQAKTLLRHGDRILWGNNHFFKVNCPKLKQVNINEPQTPAQAIDYKFAQEEIILNELSNDPIQTAIKRLEKQHEEDKQVALEKQKQEYENQLQKLRNILSPSTPYAPYMPFDPVRTGRASCNEKWVQDRDEMFRRSLSELREKIVRTKALVREANFMAEEMQKCTEFGVTLQIPASNLTPSRKRGAFVSEPAILVKRKGKPSQVWSVEKLENKLIDMRDMYNEMQMFGTKEPTVSAADPFFESQENHNLIGVANIFLEVLFHDVKLDYHVPIISQQGEVAGRLHVEIERTSGNIPERFSDIASESSFDLSRSMTQEDQDIMKLTCRIAIKQASGLPLSLSNFVFCQYRFWGCQDQVVVAPVVYPDGITTKQSKDSMMFKFDHEAEYCVPVTEEFIEHCSDGALSIEVWGHRSGGFGTCRNGWEMAQQLAKARSLADRWSELTRKLELKVQVQELNDQGEYSPVEVLPKADILCGGIIQLRQGQQRRIYVNIKPVANSGTLPLICECITNVSIGSICGRSSMSKALDSYQEDDLSILREKWSEALMRRRQYLDEQIQKIINKKDKTDADFEREQKLIHQWMSLTEERNAVLVPEPGSGIPGAPADWNPPKGLEPHIPVIFLDLNADDLSTNLQSSYMLPIVGQNSILPKEHSNEMCSLPILTHYDNEISVLATWDSSLHDNIYLNRITAVNERVYLILKVCVRLSHPAAMDVILRKRLCINIYKKQSLMGSFMKKIARQDLLQECGVIYEIVSNIPKASEELEDRESLAQIAAESEDTSPLDDGETYIEKYTRGVNALESILTLDKLRQSVAVKELLQGQGRTLMRKTVSVPNISHILVGDASFDSMIRSESVIDLAAIDTNGFKDFHKSSIGSDCSKTFGLGPAALKPFQPMKTLHEEAKDKNQVSLSNEISSEISKDNETEISVDENPSELSSLKKQEQQVDEFEQMKSFPPTNDSYPDTSSSNQSQKSGTPASLISSGYGSQAVSITNLSSEDSISLKSISVDDTPDSDAKELCDLQATLMSSTPSNPCQTQLCSEPVSSTEVPLETSLSLSVSKLSEHQHSDKEDEDSHHSEDDASYTSSSDKLQNGLDNTYGVKDFNIPTWLVLGESVLIRPYNTPGTVAYIGPTEFAPGIWAGVELYAPTGKNDGSVSGVNYFTCKPKYGIFVRPEKLMLDKRGRAMKTHKSDKIMRRSMSKVEGLNNVSMGSTMKRSISKSDGLTSVRKSTSRADNLSNLSKAK